jgi:ribosomal protein S18 acetylase RimI-like enzyme
MIVRDAERKDLAAVLALMAELADHEGVRQYLTLTPEALAECVLGEPKRFHVLVAAEDDAVAGYASYLFHFAPWAAREYLYLDDLYVAEPYRGRGVGALLMRRIAEIALERDVDARWHVELENRSAQNFYRGLGAELRARFTTYWLREAMRAHLRPL